MAFKGVMLWDCLMFLNKVGFLAIVSQAFKFSNIVPCSILCFGET